MQVDDFEEHAEVLQQTLHGRQEQEVHYSKQNWKIIVTDLPYCFHNKYAFRVYLCVFVVSS